MKKKRKTRKRDSAIGALVQRKRELARIEDGLNQIEAMLRNQFDKLNLAQQRIASFIMATGVDPFHTSLPVMECYPKQSASEVFEKINKELAKIRKVIFPHDNPRNDKGRN